MADILTLSAPDLAALLCSRVCHDIISPVGAINNGLELLEEGGADEDAMRLIKTSARNASARLQFARIAFGAAGSAGMQIDTGDAEAVAQAFFANEKPELEWKGTRALLPKNKVKLLLNLLMIANVTIPRGGKLTVELHDVDTAPRFTLTAKGPMVRVPARFLELHSGVKPEEPIDAHSVQPYYTLLLAREAGMKISIHASAEEIVMTAE
ncbi:histidine phosphotransferase ChpT [Aerobium aerolatum]|uniref:Histidine phosphotransferase ChpT n=1 Tax=Aquamicrobium aerolatum DSM 21857 TaxID=1121003 RepID=A0A1I3RQ98_9HYPH|nr:histidine phosphotransferase family protein [Aquamicrobium aerolatum]SFJ48743.1 histidine phosphotransferase ChpT [Aquamicrobium aerolatum DSM 21857]